MGLFDDGDKTEPATGRKRADARRRGNIPKSSDLNIAVLLLAVFAVIHFIGLPSVKKVSRMMIDILARMADFRAEQMELTSIFAGTMQQILDVVLPFAVTALIVGLVINVSQVGFLITGETVKPDLKKLNPLKGVGKIFSIRALTRTVFGIFKISIVGGVLVWTLWEELTRTDGPGVLALLDAQLGGSVVYLLELIVKMGLRGVLALLVLAIFDLIYQRWQHEKDLMMSKQEVREEMLSLEGDPKVKERRKRIQQQLVHQQMMHGVPKADVVVSNPTHYAVAIKYDRATMGAPRCVAKGEGHVARRIREIAMEHGVPVVEKPELARTLYRFVEIGEEIPQEFYRVVAEFLAFVYKMSRRATPAEQSAV